MVSCDHCWSWVAVVCFSANLGRRVTRTVQFRGEPGTREHANYSNGRIGDDEQVCVDVGRFGFGIGVGGRGGADGNRKRECKYRSGVYYDSRYWELDNY
jgi:hypothetical protein